MTAEAQSRPRLGLRGAFALLVAAAKEWSEDKAPRLGAALAYYTAFSLAPLLVIVIAVAGLVFGQSAAQDAIVAQIQGLMGAEGADIVTTVLENAQQPATSTVAAIIGVVTLLLGALGAFGQLQDALNTIWEVKPKPGRGLWGVLRDRLLSLTMVLVLAFFLMVALVVSAAAAAAGNFAGGLLPVPPLVLEIGNFILSFAVITLMFALLFKYVPDARIAWRDVWIGALVTALLFTIGKTAIGLYLGNASVGSTYGAAGSLVVLLVWVYYSAQILFFGAEITQAYANKFGSRVEPEAHAQRVSETERAEQGLPRQDDDGQAAAGAAPPASAVPVPVRAELVQPAAAAGRLQRGQDYVVALLTFAAGLGAGAMVALNSGLERRRRRR
jgi:membrane protein